MAKKTSNKQQTTISNDNITKVQFQRKDETVYTADIYTFDNKKYRLEVSAKDQTQAHVYAMRDALEHGVKDIRCLVLFKQSPEHINVDTQPLHVHLVPRTAITA